MALTLEQVQRAADGVVIEWGGERRLLRHWGHAADAASHVEAWLNRWRV